MFVEVFLSLLIASNLIIQDERVRLFFFSSLFLIEVIISIVAAYRLHIKSESKQCHFEYSFENAISKKDIVKFGVHVHHQVDFPIQNFSLKKGQILFFF